MSKERTVGQPPRTEFENNQLSEDVLAWCAKHYGHENPSVDTTVEAVVSLLFGDRRY